MQSASDPDLPLESRGAEHGREFWKEHLECDEAVVLEVTREIHRGHAAATELSLKRVTVVQGVSE